MTIEELLKKLDQIANNGDLESAHMDADDALLEYINNPEVTIAYDVIEKWYA